MPGVATTTLISTVFEERTEMPCLYSPLTITLSQLPEVLPNTPTDSGSWTGFIKVDLNLN